VRGAVERGTDVVAHAAVHTYVGANAIDVLDGTDLVEREHGRPDQRPPGLDRQVRQGEAPCRTLLLHDLEHAGGEVAWRGRVVLCGVRDAKAAAEIELGHLDAELTAERVRE